MADVRGPAGTGEQPLARFAREAQALRPLRDRPGLRAGRTLLRKVHTHACIELDGNRDSLPWRLIGAEVAVEVQQGTVRLLDGAHPRARHPERAGRGNRGLDPAHWDGIVAAPVAAGGGAPAPSLLRPLSHDQAVAGGAW